MWAVIGVSSASHRLSTVFSRLEILVRLPEVIVKVASSSSTAVSADSLFCTINLAIGALTLAWAEDCCDRLLFAGFSGLLPTLWSVAVALFLFVRLRGLGAGCIWFFY